MANNPPKGIAVPFTFTQEGYPTAVQGEQTLHDSLFTILSTVPGERIYRPTFGSYLRYLIFENINRATGYRIRAEIFRAVGAWEPRVALQDVLFEVDGSTITVHVQWRANGNLTAVTSLSFPKGG